MKTSSEDEDERRLQDVFIKTNVCWDSIEEIISDTSKFENEDPTLTREASLQRFLRKLKQKNFFNEIKYDKLYPSASALARIYGTPKMDKFSSSDSVPKLRSIVLSIGTFNYNLAHFLYDLHLTFSF